jgi:predicted Zn-dependent protease
MPADSDQRWSGWYFDGRTAQRTPVVVHVQQAGLTITPREGASRWWPFAEVRQTQGTQPSEPIRLERGSDPAEVLIISDVGILAAIRAVVPARVMRLRGPARWYVWAAATAGTVVAIVAVWWGLYAWGIPALADAVATRLPVAWEEQLGEAVTDTIAPGERRCSGPAQHAALDEILGKLTSSGPPAAYRFHLIVTTDEIPNAFAAPGGFVVVTRGLLRLSDGPEEVAGVMAHEIQHVVHRHGTKLLVRELSLQALVSLAAGDLRGLRSTMEAARSLGGLRYRRADEMVADHDAVGLLASSRIDPRGLELFLKKIKQASVAAQLPVYLSTHPPLDERIAAVGSLAAGTLAQPLPLLPDYPWEEITQICQ